MSKTSTLRTLIAASILALAAAAPVGAQVTATPRVSIRVYDSATTGEEQRASAILTASAIVGETGVHAAWFDCTGDSQSPGCGRVNADRELIVRIAPTAAPGTIVSRGSIESRSVRSAAGLILGFAVVEPSTGAGALATIFLDRVSAIAHRTAVPSAALLGRAIAHEVGHLLLGTNAHARSGLMREVWTDAELMLDRPEDWLFAEPERAALEPYSVPEHTSRAGIRRPRLALRPDK